MELRDKDKSKWHGKGVTKAVSNINDVLAPELVKAGLDPVEQVAIDTMMLKIVRSRRKDLGSSSLRRRMMVLPWKGQPLLPK